MSERSYHGVPGSTPMSGEEFRALMGRPRPYPKSPELQALDGMMGGLFEKGGAERALKFMESIPDYEPTKH
ncbi:MAG: hypothetical protein WC880_01480 [Candidatus Paceibacterota bacterium]